MTKVNRLFTRRDLLIIVAAVLGVVLYVLTTHILAGSAGFPLDDAWIHQTYGRNLAQTGHWEYVPGVSSAGSTSPFYTVLLAIGYTLHIPFFAWTYGLGALALVLCGLIGARLADRLFPQLPRVGLWTGLALVTAWHHLWAAASGMETLLFGSLSLSVIYVSWLEADNSTEVAKSHFLHGLIFGLLGAILIATRPEGVILVGLLVLAMIIAHPQPLLKNLLWWIVGASVGGLVGVIPYALLNLSLNGTILPTTFSAKQAENAPLLAQPFLTNLWAMLQPLTAGGQLVLVPGIVWASWRLGQQHRRHMTPLHFILIVWPFVLILLYVLRLPAYYQHGRYVIPALPPLIVLGIGGTLGLLYPGQRNRWLWVRVIARSLAATAIALFAIFWIDGALIYAHDVELINSDMVVAAHWLADNVPPDQLLAVHDIGAVGYFAPRPMLDLAGLVSPEVIPIILDPNALMKLMEARGVRYLMVLPNQNPILPDDPRLCLRFNANGLMGGMAIYALAWNGHC